MNLSIRQQKYKKNRLAGMNQYNAARAAGYSESTSKRGGVIEKAVSESIRNAFERKGLTDKYLANHAFEGLNATKFISVNSQMVEVPDWVARHKYFESICKITERMRERFELTGKNGDPLPIPIINIYNAKNTTDRILCPGESTACTEQPRISV
jgi:hypothetical protein